MAKNNTGWQGKHRYDFDRDNTIEERQLMKFMFPEDDNPSKADLQKAKIALIEMTEPVTAKELLKWMFQE